MDLQKGGVGPIGDILGGTFNFIIGLAGMPPLDWSDMSLEEREKKGHEWIARAMLGLVLFSIGSYAWLFYTTGFSLWEFAGFAMLLLFAGSIGLIERHQGRRIKLGHKGYRDDRIRM